MSKKKSNLLDVDIIFSLNRFKKFSDIKYNIRECEKNYHRQQVAYSSHENCLTQVCFSCKIIRTNLIEHP